MEGQCGRKELAFSSGGRGLVSSGTPVGAYISHWPFGARQPWLAITFLQLTGPPVAHVLGRPRAHACTWSLSAILHTGFSGPEGSHSPVSPWTDYTSEASCLSWHLDAHCMPTLLLADQPDLHLHNGVWLITWPMRQTTRADRGLLCSLEVRPTTSKMRSEPFHVCPFLGTLPLPSGMNGQRVSAKKEQV